MQAMQEYRTRIKGLPDLLNWGLLVDKGVLLNKDGSFQTAFYFRGQDLSSSTHSELAAVSAYVNAAMMKLGSGWLFNVDSIRVKATTYPDENRSFFPDPTTYLIEAERRGQHETEGMHFDNDYALTLTYLVPAELQSQITALFVDDDSITDEPSLFQKFVNSVSGFFNGSTARLATRADIANATQLLARFKGVVHDVIGALSAGLQIRQMSSDELLTFLHNCLTGLSHPVRTPAIPMYLDAILGSKDFYTGLTPRIGKKHIRVVSIFGFPGETIPGILDSLNRLSFEFRWSTRFIPLDKRDAEKRIEVFRRNWYQKRHGLAGLAKEVAGGGGQTWQNSDAVRMAVDADAAVNENSEGLVRYGFYTTVLVIMADDAKTVDINAKAIEKLLGNASFPSFIEDINAVEAFIGSLPGHGFQNVRRPLAHTLNLADLLPLTAVWSGPEAHPAPADMYPANSPPLLYGKTSGSTPFRLCLHVGDLGHFAVFGPPGAGKSTLLNLIIAQHFRYKRAQAFCFDYGYSMVTLCEASGGFHCDIAAEGSKIGFCPLAQIDSRADRAWAAGYIELLVTLRLPEGESLSVSQQNEIARSVNALANDTTESRHRTITHFLGTVQDQAIKEALLYYTVDDQRGVLGHLLDAEEDSLTSSNFMVFETMHLMSMGDKAVIPVFMYLFRQIEKRVSKAIPTLIPIDEGFRSFGHPLAITRLKEWLETMRKENAAVGFATQNPGAVIGTDIGSTIMQTTATKFMLPNPEAMNAEVAAIYRSFGLNDRQIQNIAYARKKRDYYVMNSDGRRMFELGLGKVALAFVGASGKEHAAYVRSLIAKYGDLWVFHYLKEREVPQDWCDYWLRLNQQFNHSKEIQQ